MANARLWHLAQQLRQMASATAEANQLWNDQSGAQIRGRYLRPHEQSAHGQVDALRAHDTGVERVSAAVREAQVHYEESRIAGELVVREVQEAEYAVSTTHDFIRRGLTNEGRAAQLQDQAVTAAQQANAAGAAAAGEHGQRGVAVSYSRLPRKPSAVAALPRKPAVVAPAPLQPAAVAPPPNKPAGAAWPNVENPKLARLVGRLYKGTTNPDRVGDGTTADAIRNELETGNPTHGRRHRQKGREMEKALTNFLTKHPDASTHDRQVAQQLLGDLRSARGAK